MYIHFQQAAPQIQALSQKGETRQCLEQTIPAIGKKSPSSLPYMSVTGIQLQLTLEQRAQIHLYVDYKYICTLLHNLRLVESADTEPWIPRANCKAIRGLSTGGSGAPNLFIVQGSTVTPPCEILAPNHD